MNKFAVMFDEMANIAIRSGRHCVHSWFEDKKIYNSARVSLYLYNTLLTFFHSTSSICDS